MRKKALMLFAGTTVLCLLLVLIVVRTSPPDFVFMDQYLANWDKLNVGDTRFLASMRRDKERFESELTYALEKGDKRAPARLVCYGRFGIIQIPSPLGSAFLHHGGASCDYIISIHEPAEPRDPIRDYVQYFRPHPVYGRPVGDYTKATLRSWWASHKASYTGFPLYDEWLRRASVKSRVGN